MRHEQNVSGNRCRRRSGRLFGRADHGAARDWMWPCVERGTFPGEKNMFGGVLHRLPALEKIFPDFWDRAPLERHIVKKGVTFMTGESSFSTTIEAGNFDRPPYNGYTVFRPRFDRWLADEAVAAGATLITRATVDDVVLKKGGWPVSPSSALRATRSLRWWSPPTASCPSPP